MPELKRYGDWALVTGASAGIGMAFAHRLAAERLNLALVARRADRLEKLADELGRRHGVRTRVIAQDLGADGAAERVAEAVRDLDVGVLINNAGFSAAGRFERVPREKHVEMIRVNCVAVAALTHVFLPPMKSRGRGSIIIFASAAAHHTLIPVPTF